ncbi:MAG TPA: hypothetical protein VFY89_10375, partial [Ktedonobacterales bacterium]
MSEYQRYEFMTCERPLTQTQLAAVNALSSHIEATSTHALIEYHWGDFKHNPIDVLHKFFDGFLYWANWGAPQLALRFPHGILPADLLAGYDLDDLATFTQHADYDILDVHFGELEGPDEWIEYELGSLIGLRDELLEGDTRALYVIWLASRKLLGSYDEEEEYEISVPPVPPGFGALTEAQRALAELLQVPDELLAATGRHSTGAKPRAATDLAPLVMELPPERRDAYVIRLARNEPGLSHQLARELRELRADTTSATPPPGEHVAYATLLAESQAIKAHRERERQERERLAHEQHLRDIHEHQDTYWRQVEQAVERSSGAGYDEAASLLIELRGVADHYQEGERFQARFLAWVQSHMRRPAFVKRLR